MQIPDSLVRYRALFGPVAVCGCSFWRRFCGRRSSPMGRPSASRTAEPKRPGWTRTGRSSRRRCPGLRASGSTRLPLGEAMAELGQSFVGTAYVPQTLEVEGPEGLVINFRGLDCVTFVENVFALSRFARDLPGRNSWPTERPPKRRTPHSSPISGTGTGGSTATRAGFTTSATGSPTTPAAGSCGTSHPSSVGCSTTSRSTS